MTPVPASEYARFVTSGLEQNELTYYNRAATDPSAAGKLPEYDAMTAAFKTLSEYKPPSFLGDGPFRLKAMNTFEAKLVTWKGFFDTSNIHVGGLTIYEATTNQLAYPLMFDGTVDMSPGVYLPPPIAKRWKNTPDSHVVAVPWMTVNMVFNDHIAPLDNSKVRQALAYLIPRKQMAVTTYGMISPAGTAVAHPDGIFPPSQTAILTKRQIQSLNSYPLDPSKAASLLHAAGLHKSAGRWLLSDGKPFTLTLAVDGGQSNVVTDFEVAAKALTKFGIRSSVLSLAQATWEADYSAGNFQIIDWLGGGTDPLQEIAAFLGSGTNFASPGHRGMGFGPTADVPGLGTVNLPQTITRQSMSVASGQQFKTLTWDWARLVNQQLPYLQYSTYAGQVAYSTKHFVDWPPSNNEAYAAPFSPQAGLVLALEQGYIRPRAGR